MITLVVDLNKTIYKRDIEVVISDIAEINNNIRRDFGSIATIIKPTEYILNRIFTTFRYYDSIHMKLDNMKIITKSDKLDDNLDFYIKDKMVARIIFLNIITDNNIDNNIDNIQILEF